MLFRPFGIEVKRPIRVDPVGRAENNGHNYMTDFNRKVEETTTRVSKSVSAAAERLEKESADLIKYLNEEVVPAVREHSTKALRTASEKLVHLADYMDQHSPRRP
jgi:hypothetical protein